MDGRTVLSLVFTTVYQWGWVFKFLNAGKLPLALGIFLVFPLLAFVAPLFARTGKPDDLLARTAAASALLPLVFALYSAAVPANGARFGLLVVDSAMPGMDGFALVEAAQRELGRALPTVFLLSTADFSLQEVLIYSIGIYDRTFPTREEMFGPMLLSDISDTTGGALNKPSNQPTPVKSSRRNSTSS